MHSTKARYVALQPCRTPCLLGWPSGTSACRGPVSRARFIEHLLYAEHGAQSSLCAISLNPPSSPVRWGLFIALFIKGGN